jgi:hypothetical protein
VEGERRPDVVDQLRGGTLVVDQDVVEGFARGGLAGAEEVGEQFADDWVFKTSYVQMSRVSSAVASSRASRLTRSGWRWAKASAQPPLQELPASAARGTPTAFMKVPIAPVMAARFQPKLRSCNWV